LRRLADEPLAVPDRALRHVTGCDRCQGESDEIAANAALAARLLSSPASVGDIDREWALLQDRLREPGQARHRAGTALWRARRRLASASLGTTAATFVVPGSITNGEFGLLRWNMPPNTGGAGQPLTQCIGRLATSSSPVVSVISVGRRPARR